jgi:hypothetical protein
MMYGGNARSDGNYIVRNGAVAVPSDFMGLHFNAWPIFNSTWWAAAPYPWSPSGVATAPTIGFGTYRTHDSGYAFWYHLETAAGVYDFSNLDTLITTHRTAGRTVIFCLYGTPNFYLADGNPNKGTSKSVSTYPDNTSPNGLTGLSNFVTALVTRYNDAAGAWRVANPTLGKGLQAFELWNEPVFDGNGVFWVGTVGQMVDVSYTAHAAAKAVDADLPVVSPGFIASNTMFAWLQGTGTINTGVTGKSLIEANCIHYYRQCPPATKLSSYTDILIKDADVKANLAVAGVSNLPLWATEVGIGDSYPETVLALIAAQSPSFRYSWYGRQLLVGAALGYKKWIAYAWEPPYSCSPVSDPDGVAKAINDVHVNVAGKTIKNAYYDAGGPVTLQFSDGSSFSI